MCPCLTTGATAEQKLRAGYSRALWQALFAAALIHLALFLVVPSIEVAPYRLPPAPVIETVRVPDFRVEPPPKEVPRRRQSIEIVPAGGVSDEETIDSTELVVDEIIEPPPLRERPFTEVFDSPPVVLTQVRPVYPELARQSELEGTVFVRIGVDEFGDVAWAEIEQGVPGLNEAVLAAVAAWTFEPARQGDLPVAAQIVVPVRFVLRG
jgi:protein TonB